jgi:hypothetical protein
MITIFYGKNSLHCQVAAALLLSSRTGKNVREYVHLNGLKYNELVYGGAASKNKVYYFSAQQDHQIFPNVIKSLEEIFGLEKCEFIEVAGPVFILMCS